MLAGGTVVEVGAADDTVTDEEVMAGAGAAAARRARAEVSVREEMRDEEGILIDGLVDV